MFGVEQKLYAFYNKFILHSYSFYAITEWIDRIMVVSKP